MRHSLALTVALGLCPAAGPTVSAAWAQAVLSLGSDRPSSLGPRTGGNRGIVALNPGDFDRSPLPQEPQLLVVVFRFSGTRTTPESRILDRVREDLDWAAMARFRDDG